MITGILTESPRPVLEDPTEITGQLGIGTRRKRDAAHQRRHGGNKHTAKDHGSVPYGSNRVRIICPDVGKRSFATSECVTI